MKATPPKVDVRSVDLLVPYIRNSRTHSDAQIAQIAESIREFGWTNPVLVDGENGIIAGHGRVLAARKLGVDEVPIIELAHMSEAQKRAYIIADNKLALNAGWDDEVLRLELAELDGLGFDLDLTGFSPGEIESLMSPNIDEPDASEKENAKGKLSDRFMLPPFTVLNARDGWWRDRKRGWLALGIKSEEGRDKELIFGANKSDPVSVAIFKSGGGTSVFDPVLCELVYRWFSPLGGTILDPFAGGSVRGVVASKLGRRYVGHELRHEQVTSNRTQSNEICADDEMPPTWICGDSRTIDRSCKDVQADMIFSCPPYADLEVYSDDPKDLSTLGYEEFKDAYFEIIKKSCDRLKNDRFACFVVGEVRDKKGNYYDFIGDTVQAFREAGLHYYNEAILVTESGSLPLRVAKQFSSSRKLGKTHQNVLIFVKGDGKKAATACGPVDVSDDCFDAVSGTEGGDA